MDAPRPLDRRQFLRPTAGTLVALSPLGSPVRAADGRRLKVAAVFTEVTYRSHAHVILENFLQPYYFNGGVTDPGCDVASFYGDQFPVGRDMARAVAKEYRIPLYPTVAEAVCLGGKELAVDAVLSIGEHGSYPTPRLDIKYAAPDFRAFRELGQSWSVLTEATEEPKGIDRLGKVAPPPAPPGSARRFNPIRKG
jgi:hypothetical protein